MLKATPSRIPLNKLKTKNRKNKFKTLWGKNRYSKTPRYTKISFTIGSQDCKIKRSQVLTMFTQLSRSLNVRRKLIPQMRSLVSERIVIISIFMGWLSEIVIAVP